MADPLSIAAGVAGLLSFGIQVTQSLIGFYTAYKDQDSDLAKITENLDSLQGIFRALDVAVQDRRSQADAQELFQEVEKATQKCDEIIKELDTECQKFHKHLVAGFKGRILVAGRRAAYPFRKSTLQKLEEDIGEIRENLSFALDVMQLRSHNHIQHSVSEVKSLVERINASLISDKIRAWLMAPDASLDHNTAYAKCHQSTGLWFINGHHFATWLVKRNSFLWLNGFVGCGKSVLCSMAIQHISQEMKQRYKVGIAFFYFSFNDESKQTDNGMLRALLLQLSGQLEDGQKNLEQLHVLYPSGIPPVEALLDLLARFLRRFHDSYILLDALDESPRDRNREGVLKAIQAIRNWSIPGVHILATSRNELDIRAYLDLSCNQDLSMRNPETDEDIVNFIAYQLNNDPKLQRWKARHEEIRTKLATSAQGVFRYIECQFNALRRARNQNQLDQCLRSMPRDLDETYERILCSIDEEYTEDVRRILTILCSSTRPLTVKELIHAHAVNLGEPPYLDYGSFYEQHDLVDICLGLIEIVATEHYKGQSHLTVRIAHFSVQEYLQSDRILHQNSRGFAIQTAAANTEMAQICLVYILEPGLSRVVLEATQPTAFPLAHFAARYWFHHYEKSGEKKPGLEKLMLRLFKDKTKSFATWIRLYDMDAQWNVHVDYDRPDINIPLPVYYAAMLGIESVLTKILAVATEGGSLLRTVNAQGGRLINALQAASFLGHEKAVQILLDHGADVNAQGGKYGNALYAALINRYEKLVQMLLDHGADVNAQGGEYSNPLYAASINGYEKLVQILLDHGADVNAQGGEYSNALYAALINRYEKLVQMLLDHGADVNAQGGEYSNPLYAASINGYEKLVQILLDHGADVNAQGGQNGNALQAAALWGYKQVVQMLLDHGADVNAQGGMYGNAIQAASLTGKEALVQMLLDHGADVNAQGGMYGNAIQAASLIGEEKLVQLLLDHGANVSVQGGQYGNALQLASLAGKEKLVHLLLDHGADVNAQGGQYGNALQLASLAGQMKVVQVLLDQGADINAQSGEYGNALQAAASSGDEQVVKILLDRGADVNAQGGRYGSALQAASSRGYKQVVQILLDQSADTNVASKNTSIP
ncbi:NACHT nucleoside triphosphatase [Penicillium cf. griseofulvum]|uniref:NACHT nucleoside triphosphatase n=1 Tax=Penicillium cf. griseofulvum TaxID=2972120 RepID=A0A9W9J163_9EURO|nr:NACHT nucleoside triphosphatase [Penicillium cf. griseofulvum]KAJ5429473.1 NACHT nucleoside triphosphatase [Penicillium cf. griseofulvum]KAJ5436745.1 NACHT nucleoside triphosphatase [Penicillium cf. griseofulvum]